MDKHGNGKAPVAIVIDPEQHRDRQFQALLKAMNTGYTNTILRPAPTIHVVVVGSPPSSVAYSHCLVLAGRGTEQDLAWLADFIQHNCRGTAIRPQQVCKGWHRQEAEVDG